METIDLAKVSFAETGAPFVEIIIASAADGQVAILYRCQDGSLIGGIVIGPTFKNKIIAETRSRARQDGLTLTEARAINCPIDHTSDFMRDIH